MPQNQNQNNDATQLSAVYDRTSKIWSVTGENIKPFSYAHDIEQDGDVWHSVNCAKTGEPIFDINLWFDDSIDETNAEHNYDPYSNIKNYGFQFVELEMENGTLKTGSNFRSGNLQLIQ